MAFRSSKLTNKQLNMKRIEEKVRIAKFEKKIFIVMGRYEAIRKSLIARGWLEKVMDTQMAYIPPGSERLIIASLLKNSPFHFVWQPKFRPLKINSFKHPFNNSVQRSRAFDYTAKDGLKNCAEELQWNYSDGIVDLEHIPRTHIINDKIAKDEFFEDYRKTTFISFIKFLSSMDDIFRVFSTAGTISTDCIEFTITKLELLMRIDDHDDVDMSKLFDVCTKFPKNQKNFLFSIQQIMKGNKKFRFVSDSVVEVFKSEVKMCASQIEERWPHLRYDGFHNIWIFKPLGWSSGNGIILHSDADRIREILADTSRTYIAQKYIERPMLIHDRKFDIRIYLLTVIQNDTVNIWLYKDCYIKFATKPFDLESYAKSIHVTNYAVQKNFMNAEDSVPEATENMWTLKQLINYFGLIEKPRLWEAKIYPAIKKSLLAMIIPSLEGTEIEHKCFELNGADFMITDDHETSLIEINSVPALFFSRVMKEMITDKLLEDVIKVVIDYSKNNEAYTGDFELIYQQTIPKLDTFVDLAVVGTKIERTVRRTIGRKKIQEDMIQATSQLIEFQNASNRYIYLKEN